jgi:hypothetical protein
MTALRLLAAAGLAAVLGASAPALAYIPPSGFILKSMATKRAGTKEIRVKSVVTALEGERALPVHFKVTTVYNPQTGALRSFASDDANQRLYGVERFLGGKSERRVEPLTTADALLFASHPAVVAESLKSKGIPVRTEEELLQLPTEEERLGAETEWLARWNGGYAWVIGKESRKALADRVPQLWVEKDTFLPVRLIFAPKPNEPFVELSFESYRHFHEFPFPRLTTLSRKAGAVLKDEVQDVAFASELPEFKAPLAATGLTDAGNAASSELRELIVQYYENVR